jgi:hypothetical protein
MPARNPPLSKAFDKPEGLDSPPAIRQSASDYTHLPADGLLKRLHVLIVDDNDINLKVSVASRRVRMKANGIQVLSTFMRKIGCTFETASDGLSALQQYKQSDGKFDYILMGMHTSNSFPDELAY